MEVFPWESIVLSADLSHLLSEIQCIMLHGRGHGRLIAIEYETPVGNVGARCWIGYVRLECLIKDELGILFMHLEFGILFFEIDATILLLLFQLLLDASLLAFIGVVVENMLGHVV